MTPSIISLKINDAVSFVHCDVTEESEVQNAVDFTVEKHGKLNVMFNNAGTTGTLTPTILDVNRADFNEVFDVNIRLRLFLGCQACG